MAYLSCGFGKTYLIWLKLIQQGGKFVDLGENIFHLDLLY